MIIWLFPAFFQASNTTVFVQFLVNTARSAASPARRDVISSHFRFWKGLLSKTHGKNLAQGRGAKAQRLKITQIRRQTPLYHHHTSIKGVLFLVEATGSPFIKWYTSFVKWAMPVATFLMAVICGTDKLRCDLFVNMVLVSFGVVISSYGEIHFNVVGSVYQVTGIFAEALRLVLTQVLLQKKGLTLNPITSLYYIAPCSFVFLFVPWYLLEMPEMEVSQIQFNIWIFFSNALCALALNFSIFLVIGRTGAVTIRVAGVLKDWILIALSTVIFPESTITRLNIIGYAIALCGVVMYNYLKAKDIHSPQIPGESIIERATKDLKAEKRSSNVYFLDENSKNSLGGMNGRMGSHLDAHVDEEAPLIPSSKGLSSRSKPS
ncbi:hypothetical protein DH2020_020237 [Rehmannia glutinosa]|uniref:Sugar phosphate transporter domain-containing protein n=1 Tax=Rehmannia glutinosa TaxID=99300 RepID=A0ABR0WFR2_REHGL